MNRDDWVFVGVRLTGLILLVVGTVSLATLAGALLEGAVVPFFLFAVLAELLLGVFLFLGAPALLAWLARKDRQITGPTSQGGDGPTS